MQAPSEAAQGSHTLTTAQRARAERQRLRARALRDARLVRRGPPTDAPDTGGGFLPEESTTEPPRARTPPAPVLDPTERPRCLECGRAFAHSYLLDSFEHPVCDACRDESGAHALVTRSEARAHFLLQECDLDAREPALRCVRRRNPHGACFQDMRLYLRAQVEERALLVWGSAEALERERARREEARARSQHKQTARRLRALRMDVRSSLFGAARTAHQHQYGAEQYDACTDTYSRACDSCAHVLTYEKM